MFRKNILITSLFHLFTYIPLINLLCLILLITHSFLLHGRIPTYSIPDPKTLIISYQLFITSEILLFLSVILYPSLVIIIFFNKAKPPFLIRKIGIYIFFFVLLILIYRIETLGLGEWILD